MSKARVVPLKRITIPRLELSAATVSVRLDKMIKRELELAVDRSFLWTDSTNSHTRFHTFVTNRLSQIHDCPSPSQWRYVPSKLNPADDASRGLKVDELLTNSRWKVGPPFFCQSEDKWPSHPGVEELSEDDPEVKKDAKVGGLLTDCGAIQVDQLLERFSSWHSLKKFVAWFLRYKTSLRKFCVRDKEKSVIPAVRSSIELISVPEMREAERSIVKYVQEKHFKEEIESLKRNQDIVTVITSQRPKGGSVKRGSSIFGSDPVLVDGILVVSRLLVDGYGMLRCLKMPNIKAFCLKTTMLRT